MTRPVTIALDAMGGDHGPSVVIPGASSPRQAIDNAQASDLPRLSPELHRRLSDFYTAEVRDHIRGPY